MDNNFSRRIPISSKQKSRTILILKAVIAVIAFVLVDCQFTPLPPTAISIDYTPISVVPFEGFGAAGAYDALGLKDFADAYPAIPVYDLLFGVPASDGTGQGIGLDIYRIRNTYGFDPGSDMGCEGGNIVATCNIVSAAKSRNGNLKVELVPWSPMKTLKSNGSTIGANGTLINLDAPDGMNYIYQDYAAWWVNSLTDSTNGWAQPGLSVMPDYISIQNEPDYPASYDSCVFSPTENLARAGYKQAFEAVYNAMYDRFDSAMPKMIGPETMGYGGAGAYITALNATDKSHLYAYSFHPYSDVGGTGNNTYPSYDNPDDHLSGMHNFVANYASHGEKLFMTEFARGQTPTFDSAVKLAWQIHNFLVEMKVCAYFHWTFFRVNADGKTTGGMINVNPNTGTYEIRDTYYFFKHYTAFTDPGWYVINALNNSDNLRVTAFKGPTGKKLTVVILNKSNKTETFPLTVDGYTIDADTISVVYRSSATEHWLSLGAYDREKDLTIPPLSIVTIAFTNP
jgi:glucuronoarabinoxylan endo-1,4-beta-xylanase